MRVIIARLALQRDDRRGMTSWSNALTKPGLYDYRFFPLVNDQQRSHA
jgi:hypothetical protein